MAVDVRDEYRSLLQRGESDSAALEAMLDNYSQEADDIDDAPSFWLAFADTQWKLGRLDCGVKREALNLIETELNDGCSLWGKSAKQRARALTELRARLLSPQPERKPIRTVKEYRCEWADGDIYALELRSNKAREMGLSGRYLLIQKVGEFLWSRFPRHLNPVIRIKLSDNGELPRSIQEFDALKYIQVYARPYSLRFLPDSGLLSAEENRAECEALRCEVDETGRLAEYKAALFITSKRSLPKGLFFVGNFGEAKPPEKEFIPRGGAHGLEGINAKYLEEDALDFYMKYM